ncbi:nSTAND1 domain-containing NTPase [Salmonirosea aquatica]|uniref:TIR domain-containing protein n=1 Tax=Salmonirosea aquatica TaxID=2654236 RepID=A0A7C9BIE3_9BACT|nr:TIR domain-containing protein [Cytophagaceae bacterium SJW1-29]
MELVFLFVATYFFQNRRMKVFLSYNSKNRAFAEAIAANLTRDGFALFFDKESIVAGDDWSNTIREGIEHSTAALILIGEEGIGPWQAKEVLTVASKQTSTPEVPYHIIPVALPSISKKTAYTPDWVLVNYQWVQYADPNDQHAYTQIVKGLRASTDKNGSSQRGENPYKGLQSFQVDDDSRFFGRTYELNQVFHDKLRFHVSIKNHNFLAVVAESGSGKSSFMQAGILAALKKGQFQGSGQWRRVTLKPGSDPLLELSTTVRREGLISDSLAFEERVLRDPDALLRTIKEQNATWVMYVDQFEEVLTQHPKTDDKTQKEKYEKRRTAFLANLTQAIETEKAVVLLSLRSDYYTHFGAYPGFKSLLESQNFTLPPIRLEEGEDWKNNQVLKDIISKSALNAGVLVDPDLEKQLIHALRGVHGKLPILQLTLDMLWKQIAPDARQITLTDFAQISKNQDLAGIIQTHADQVVDNLTTNRTDSRKLDLIRRIFVPHLVEISDGREDVRRTAGKEELLAISGFDSNEVEAILGDLSGEKARLITVDGNKVDVLHEAIIREWPLLKGWIDARREAFAYLDKLRDKAAEFEKGNEPTLGWGQLKKAKAWRSSNPDLTNGDIDVFIQKSRTRYRRDAGIALAMFLVILLGTWVGYPIYQRNQLIKVFKSPPLDSLWEASGGHLDSIHILYINKSNIHLLQTKLHYLHHLHYVRVQGTSEQNLSFLEDLTSLDSLMIDGNLSLSGLEKLAGLQSLRILDNDSLRSLSVLKKLKGLKYLTVSNSVSLSGLEKLTGLKSLTVYGNNSLLSRSGLERLTGLKSLTVYGNNSLSGLEKLTSLQSLTVSGNESLLSLSGQEVLTVSNSVSLSGLEKLTGLKSLTVYGDNSLLSRSGLERLTGLKSLTVYGNNSLSGLEKLTSLQSLMVSGNESLLSLSGLEKLTGLQSLTVGLNYSLRSLSGLGKLTGLKSLKVYGNNSLRSLNGLEKLTGLKSLAVSGNESLLSQSGLEKLMDLKSLAVYGNISLSGLDKLTGLKSLTISGNNSLSGLEKLTSLQSLTVFHKDSLRSLRIPENLKSLKSLTVSFNDSLRSLKGLDKLTRLKSLSVYDNDFLSSLSGLERIQSPKVLELGSKEFNLLKDQIYKFKNLEELIVPSDVKVDYEKLSKNNPGIKLIRENF